MSKHIWLRLMTAAFALFLVVVITGTVSLRRATSQFYEILSGIAGQVSEGGQELETAFMSALKEDNTRKRRHGDEKLASYGYTKESYGFFSAAQMIGVLYPGLAAAGIGAAGFIGITFWQERKRKSRIIDLTDYLRRLNHGQYSMRPKKREDEYSGLEDEIYKTVLLLREEREQAQKEKENLAKNLADISHQLKTPLASISLLADLLAPRVAEQEQGYVETIASQTERLGVLVAALLTAARLDADTLEMEKKEVVLQDVAEAAVDSIRPLAKAKNQQLCCEEGSGSFVGDLHWSIQAVMNVLKNCCEHTPEGGRIEVRWETNPLLSMIVIEDNGPGIPRDDLPFIFDRFYKGCRPASKESAGIGLSLAKSIVEKQNGEIRAENRAAGGARFVIKFYRN